ncbi:MAG: GspH/FimT family pseudopilin [Rhodospirillales bacterium]|nr:GspH/FimT family pseudopilin [Rhodospirillales bacterium]
MRKAATARTRTLQAGKGWAGTASPVGGAQAAFGFTLLEVLVVLVLLAIIAGFAGTRLIASMDGPALRSASGELANVLRHARGRAIARNEPVAVEVDVDAPSFGIPGESSYALSPKLHLTLFTAASAQRTANVGEIRFFPDGSSTGGEVTLASGDAHSYVQVDWLTGRVDVYED